MDATDEPASLIDWNTPVTNTISKPLIPLPSFDGNFEINEDNPFDDVERQIHDVFSPNVSIIDDNRDDNFLDSLIGRMEKMRLTNTSVVEETIEKNDVKNASALTTNTGNSTSDSSPWDISNLLKIRSRVASFMNQMVEDLHPKNQPTSNDQNKLVSLSQEDVSEDKALNDGFVVSTTDESRSSSSSKIQENSEIWRFYEEFLHSQSFEDIRSIVPCWEEITYYSGSDEENEGVSNFNAYPENAQTPLSRKHTPLQVEKIRKLRAPLVFQEPTSIRVKKTNHVTKQGPLKAVAPIVTAKDASQKDSPSVINKKSASLLKMKRRSAPVATSTPQSVRGTSLNSRLSTPVKCTPKSIPSRAPSPDSTSGFKCIAKNRFQSKSATKSQRIPCSPVSSSTNLSFPRLVSKSTRITKNTSFTEISRGVTAKSRSIHNKENVSPFQV